MDIKSKQYLLIAVGWNRPVQLTSSFSICCFITYYQTQWIIMTASVALVMRWFAESVPSTIALANIIITANSPVTSLLTLLILLLPYTQAYTVMLVSISLIRSVSKLSITVCKTLPVMLPFNTLYNDHFSVHFTSTRHVSFFLYSEPIRIPPNCPLLKLKKNKVPIPTLDHPVSVS